MPNDFDEHAEVLESSDLPRDTVDAAVDALGFAQSFQLLMQDMGMIKVSDHMVHVGLLETCFDSFVGEFQAACICLASFKDSEEVLQKTYENCRDNHGEEVSSLVINGYKKLAERVVKTREAIRPKS